uniref:uncharacterized protein LOC118521786 n=1 Tax=Halichoerus grypus TaxID=9711 RepID=UPI0016593412|nr:uncharacterized protein LOC118521786 [Halichoerus grypus]
MMPWECQKPGLWFLAAVWPRRARWVPRVLAAWARSGRCSARLCRKEARAHERGEGLGKWQPHDNLGLFLFRAFQGSPSPPPPQNWQKGRGHPVRNQLSGLLPVGCPIPKAKGRASPEQPLDIPGTESPSQCCPSPSLPVGRLWTAHPAPATFPLARWWGGGARTRHQERKSLVPTPWSRFSIWPKLCTFPGSHSRTFPPSGCSTSVYCPAPPGRPPRLSGMPGSRAGARRALLSTQLRSVTDASSCMLLNSSLFSIPTGPHPDSHEAPSHQHSPFPAPHLQQSLTSLFSQHSQARTLHASPTPPPFK